MNLKVMDGPIYQIEFDSSIQAFFVLEGLSAFQTIILSALDLYCGL